MNQIFEFSLSYGGAVLFVIVLLEQVGLPIPAAPSLLAAGAVCAVGEANPARIMGLTILACLIADSTWFYIGRRGGTRILHFLCRIALLHNSSIEQTERSFSRHGMPIIALAKFVPGLSVVAPPLAGAFGVRASRFLFFDLLGSVLYAGFYLLLGAIFSNQVQAIMAVLHRLGIGSLVLLFALIATYIPFHLRPRSQAALQPATCSNNQIRNIQPIAL
jgi:membrane protein DedA with SNARE-associated domain